MAGLNFSRSLVISQTLYNSVPSQLQLLEMQLHCKLKIAWISGARDTPKCR